MERLDVDILKQMIENAGHSIIDNETTLCKLDSFVGDGDHGITVARGFKGVCQLLQETPMTSPSELFVKTGETLSRIMGGAIGPLFGSFFIGVGHECKDKYDINVLDFSKMLRAGLNDLQRIGGAKEGGRTMVDALIPAIIAMESSVQENVSLKRSFLLASKAAETGAENTKMMKATSGRAKFLGDKSIGYRDAGASSVALIFKSFSNTINCIVE